MPVVSNGSIFASQGYLLHFVPYARSEVELVPLACQGVRNEVELVPLACEDEMEAANDSH